MKRGRSIYMGYEN